MTAGAAVVTRGLVHIYRSEGHDVAALSGVDLSVRPGEVVGLLGPSGAGKSTLLSLLAGLFPPSAGRVIVDGTDLATLPSTELERLRMRTISLMLQGAGRNLLPYLSVADNIRFAQQAARRDGRGLPAALDVLGTLEVAHLAELPLGALTPGQLQLSALAAAAAIGPGLLLADEPTSALDHRARDVVLDALVRVNDDLGTTVVLVTHDPEVARRLPRTVTIRDGRIGGEGRRGEEYAVVNADGFLSLPADVLVDLPPGTLVRVSRDGDGYRLLPEGFEEAPS